MPAAGAGLAKALSITLLTSGENHIIRRPATAASARPRPVLDDWPPSWAPDDFALNAIALQTMETTMSARPATMSPSGLPAGLK